MAIVIEKASGGVAVMRLIGHADAQACLAQWKQANPGEYVSHLEVAERDLPADRSQRDAWKLSGGAVVIDPALLPVPQSVSRCQARKALLLAGKLDLVQPAIDAIADATGKALAQIEWDDAQNFLRTSATLAQIGAAIGLSSNDIDALFRQAAAL